MKKGVRLCALRFSLAGRCALAAICVLSCGPAGAGVEGFDSTFYGIGAGTFNLSDANQNTFIGANAGHTNSTGTSNTAVGKNAGLFNETGVENTFVGGAAGQASVGSYNTMVGSYAGVSTSAGSQNTFLGNHAGMFTTTAGQNVFVGDVSGSANTTGAKNTFLGQQSGWSNTTGYSNTYVGQNAGHSNTTGVGNVFVGAGAGFSETGSGRLYIDDCDGGSCTTPFIYGEFDNHILKVNGAVNVRANGVAKSQLHFSQNDADVGGWLTSVLENNFFTSSGARYDATGGGWIQRSSDGHSVIQGSGGLGYRVFTSSGHGVGSAFTPTVRLHINYNGEYGINANPVAGHEIHTSSGAYLVGGTWTDASSRDYKERIAPLSAVAAAEALSALAPVTYAYKSHAGQQRVGFIAEDVPELVAMKDRKGLSPMDIVAVLTRVVQEKSRLLDEQAMAIRELRAAVAALQEMRGR